MNHHFTGRDKVKIATAIYKELREVHHLSAIQARKTMSYAYGLTIKAVKEEGDGQ